MMIVNGSRAVMVLTAVAALCTVQVSARTLDDRVYKLYASAEYEQALTLLGESTEPEAHLYRALCLVGLDRQDEAQTALRDLLNASPDFDVASEEVPPRVVKLLADTRRKFLPDVVRRTFAAARERYHADDYEQARPLFERVAKVSSHADISNIEVMADMRVLAESFLDLMKTPRTTLPGAVAISANPSGSASPGSTGKATTPPIAVKQIIPAWPSTLAPIPVPTTGAVRVQISRTGSVTAAAIVTRIHPQYDSRVLATARSWEYTPATLNGVPVDSEAVVQIRVNPVRSRSAQP